MAKNENVLLTFKGGIAEVTINREAARNALNRDTLHELLEIINEIRAASFEIARVVVLRGAGEKAFVAGADIKLMQNAPLGELNDFIALGQTVMKKLEELPQIVISVIDGFAIGGGLELALAGDLIVATERAKLGQAEVTLGLIPGFGGTQRLAQRVGVGTAKRLIFLAETIGGEEAYRIGLADWFVASAELQNTVDNLTKTLLSKGPIALASAKRCIHATFDAQLSEGLDREVQEFIGLFSYADTKEGLSAFVEKRLPNFTGN